MFETVVLGIIGGWLFFIATVTDTRNTISAIVLNFIPLILGILCFVLFAGSVGWITL